MKKIHIVAFILLAVGIAVMISASSDVSEYANFEDATNEKRVRIAGELARDQEMIYEPDVDAEKFTFSMLDSKGVMKKVVLSQAKPQEFERSETVVVTGHLKASDDTFYADEILIKCPSKYKNEEVFVKGEM